MHRRLVWRRSRRSSLPQLKLPTEIGYKFLKGSLDICYVPDVRSFTNCSSGSIKQYSDRVLSPCFRHCSLLVILTTLTKIITNVSIIKTLLEAELSLS
jgi:hypothetical protein